MITNQQAEYNKKQPIDITQPFDSYISQLNERNIKRNPNEPLGYRLNRFKQIEKALDGLQSGFILISAHPNIGKTALISNLSLDAVESNPQCKVLLFTLDDTRETLFYRLNTIIANREGENLSINDSKKPQVNNSLLEASQELIELYKSGRFDLIDGSLLDSPQKMREIIAYHQQERQDIIVFIDGLFKLPTDSTEVRGQNEERAERIKNISKEFNIPCIATGELKKANDKVSTTRPQERDIPESRKYSYEADAIFLLYRSLGTFEDNEESIPNELFLTLNISKNKLSSEKGEIYTKFHRHQSKIVETSREELKKAQNREDFKTEEKSSPTKLSLSAKDL
jgi:replicative DNA helicase